jgi:hypothetical protein
LAKTDMVPVAVSNNGMAQLNFVGYTSEAQDAMRRCEWTPPALEAVK